MALDSLRPAGTGLEAPQRIHSRVTGKLYKKHGIIPASASIPSKYQTIVTDNSDNKGFNSQAKRFMDDYYLGENPGPGNYQFSHQEIEKHSTSFSKKGTGSFASKASRMKKPQSIPMPGAASYTLPSLLTTRKEFNRSTTSSNFHKPIAVNTDHLLETLKRSPAPNLYKIPTVASGKNTTVAAQAAFRSTTKRQGISVGATRIPSPSHYNIQPERKPKGPSSNFTSLTKRQMMNKPPDVPGPGAYKPFETPDPVSKQLLPRKHYLCISAPAMSLPSPIPNPGPGTYEIVDYEGPPKHYMSSGMFVSNTSRWTSDHLPSKDNPGPSTYRPEPVGRQSFIYNAQNRWL